MNFGDIGFILAMAMLVGLALALIGIVAIIYWLFARTEKKKSIVKHRNNFNQKVQLTFTVLWSFSSIFVYLLHLKSSY
ncbi:hypothetical protein [Rummeliibacillus stabekisii]|uniref:hypothetical protein n=1 Tax=Rummeliibacillus stabekisii TaxID=241244 RepID=UPI00116C2F0E|nr:hypothetical protein [Rummeliibacillus stabekisii]MBB5168995.1 ABC-type nickel/cobalt efflux system permease component RcnA [Rummeliibacillus stabekisii]GEL05634.1 hypothetical protein RST01_22610 [Rummeliibacillus stabekisii]